MKYLCSAVLGLGLILGSAPAFAQMASGGGMGGGTGGISGAAPQPQARVPDIAPPALPGVGAPAPLATGPKMQKPVTGDPTAALFTAVTSGDYNAAQDAISRGADLNAQNAFGETPIDLSVALNRNSITFLLLATRNELGAGATGAPSAAPTPASFASGGHHHAQHVKVTPVAHKPTAAVHLAPSVGTNPGTPNPAAGFLGFAPKS